MSDDLFSDADMERAARRRASGLAPAELAQRDPDDDDDDDADDDGDAGDAGEVTEARGREDAPLGELSVADELLPISAELATMVAQAPAIAEGLGFEQAPAVTWIFDRAGMPVQVLMDGLGGQHTLVLAELRADPLVSKLAGLLGLFRTAEHAAQEHGVVPDDTVREVASSEGEVAAEGEVASSEGGAGPTPRPPTLACPTPEAGPRMRVAGVLWPAGPLGITAERVARIVMAAQEQPEFHNPHDPGLSRSRFQRLLSGVPNNRLLAGALMVWFDAAGILAPARSVAQPFRTSRPLRDGLDLAAIAAALERTPLPDEDATRAVFGEAPRTGAGTPAKE